MAGIQSCFRIRLNVINILRSVNNNGALRQPTRGRHFFSFQMSYLKRGRYINESKLFPCRISIYRLASTSVTNLENVTPVLESKISQNSLTTDPASAITETSQVPSNSDVIIDESSLPPIPSPLEPESVSEVAKVVLNHLGEPTFESLGLGSWWPSGLLQSLFEYLHVQYELPWWGVITIAAFAVRIVVFPLVISTKRSSIHTHNNLPQIQVLQMKITEARQNGDYFEAAYHVGELQKFMKENNVKVFGAMWSSLLQAPIFLSMVAALRGMSNAPVESMKTGGLFWFENLTITDPYYILPVVSSVGLFFLLKFSIQSSQMEMRSPFIKYFFYGIPVAVLPVSINFSAAVQWYWTVSLLIQAIQSKMLDIPAIKKMIKLPAKVNHDPSSFPMKQKKGLEGFKESLTNMKIMKELEDRERVNAVTFERAGSGPIPRTFKKNPTKS